MTRKEQALALWAEVKACTKCAISSVAAHKVFGDGLLQARIALVGEAPGMEEDACGHPFIGSSGRILNASLAAAAINRKELFVCNVLRCHPPKLVTPDVVGNRSPLPAEVANCTPYLRATLAIVRPKVIVALGAVALNALANPPSGSAPPCKYVISEHFAHYWDTTSHADWELPPGAILVATYHPQYLTHNRKESVLSDYNKLFRHVKRMAAQP